MPSNLNTIVMMGLIVGIIMAFARKTFLLIVG